jgi:hypothetical protein
LALALAFLKQFLKEIVIPSAARNLLPPVLAVAFLSTLPKPPSALTPRVAVSFPFQTVEAYPHLIVPVAARRESMTLEDSEGHPWTANIGIGWIITIVAFTFGTALVALSIYLALWIRSKGRSVLPLAGFCVVVLALIAPRFLPQIHAHPILQDRAALATYLLWLASTFGLRYEITQYYRKTEGWEILIGPWFTYFFSAIYINYCINPFTLLSYKQYADALTSLNLSAASLPTTPLPQINSPAQK